MDGAVRAGCAGAAEGKFVEIQFAQEHRAREFEATDDFGVFRRHAIAKDAAGGGGEDARGIDVVFERDGNSVERTGAPTRVACRCFAKSRFFGECDERVERAIVLANAGEAVFGELFRGNTTASEGVGGFGECPVGGVGGRNFYGGGAGGSRK